MSLEEKSIIITELIRSVCNVYGINTGIHWLEPKAKKGVMQRVKLVVSKLEFTEFDFFITNCNYKRQLQLI